MKKTILFLALLMSLPFSRAFAQAGEIIYRDFEPDTALHIGAQPAVLSIDFDNEAPPISWSGGFLKVPGFILICTVVTNL